MQMQKRNTYLFLLFTFSAMLLAPASSPCARQDGTQDLPTIKEKTAHMESQDGFIPIHYDPVDGKLYLEVSLPGQEFLYHSSMAWDVLGLTRGQPNWGVDEAIVRFERRGLDLVLLKKNVRADFVDPNRTDLPAEAREPFLVFLEETFPIVAEEAGRVLVDGTDHFLQDLYCDQPYQGIVGVPRVLAESCGEEGFSLDLEQSSIFRPSTRATPQSTEVEALLTFVTDQPGEWARNALPDPTTFVARQRHSLSRLPEPGFPIRRADARLGFNAYPFLNPNPVGPGDLKMLGVCRWRLEKLDPSAPISEVVEPIAVYLDAAMPERVREVARLGIGYWNRVLENVGFKNALIVRDLPADADPLDPKFPIVVLWIPTRTVSNGFPVVDVRTGEIVKGVIREAGEREHLEENFYRAIEPVLEPGQPDLQTFLRFHEAGIIAHEAGHILAFLSHQNINPSVMGMRRPRLRVGPSGGLEMDLSLLYPAEPFPYDVWMMRYAYTPFEPRKEDEGLLRIVEDGLRDGMQWGHNTRRRNPRALSYLHSDDPLTVLEEDMAVRRLLLERFGPDMLHPGEPDSLLFERLIPIYFHHRHSLRAVATMLGGVEFTYEAANDYQRRERAIDSRTQRQALDALLNALSPEELLIPSRIAATIMPKLESNVLNPGVYEYGIDPTIYLPLQTKGSFDPLGWVGVLCDWVVRDLLRRVPRLADQQGTGQSDLSVAQILSRLVDETWGTPTPEQGSLADILRLVRDKVLDGMIFLAEREETPKAVVEAIQRTLGCLLTELRSRTTDDPAEQAHLEEAIRKITGIG